MNHIILHIYLHIICIAQQPRYNWNIVESGIKHHNPNPCISSSWLQYLKFKTDKGIGFQILLRTKYVLSLVKIHWRMLILECSQGCYAVKIWPGDLDLWPWKSIGFQICLRTKYVPSLVKIHWRMLILECSQGCHTVKIWPLDLWLEN